MSSIVDIFNEVSEEPEFKQSTQALFDSIEPNRTEIPYSSNVKPLDVASPKQAVFSSEMAKIEQKPIDFKPEPAQLEPKKPEKRDYYKELGERLKQITPEQISKMSLKEKMELNEDMKLWQEMQQSKGFTKGVLSGASLGLSEKIPGLKPEEDEFLGGLGEFVGSVLPIAKLYNFLGKPLVSLAARSPVARKGIESLARMTGFGLTGAAYETGKETVKTGEVPSAEEIAKYGLEWAAFDGALQVVGKVASFAKGLSNFSSSKGITQKEALNETLDHLHSKKIDIEKNPEEAVKAAEEFLSQKEKPTTDLLPESTKLVEKGNVERYKELGEELSTLRKEGGPKERINEIMKERNLLLEDEEVAESLMKDVKTSQVKVQPKKLEIEKIEPSSQKVKEAATEIEKIPSEKRTPEQTQVVALEETVQPNDAGEKLVESLPTPESPSFTERMKSKILKPKTELSKQLEEIKQDYYGKKWGIEWDNYNKWRTVFKEKKISSQDKSDMMFYIENTGNPFKGGGDTFEALNKRMSPESKKLVEDVVKPHFDQWLKVINESAYTKKINPRDFLEGVYVPHFYDGDTKKGAKQAMEMLSKRFGTKNPFANMRTFLTYNEALQKAGMKPRFDNIQDLLNEYDRVMTRVLSNSEFAGKIGELEKEIGSKFVIRSNSPKYGEVKREGWVPFDDPYLRRYVAGTDKNGKPIFATLESPALVHPDAADAFTGIFVKDAKKPGSGGDWLFWKPYDALSDFLKSAHVSLSGFHYLTLAEESAKSSGIRLINNFKKGGELLKDPVFMREFVEAGGVVGHNPELINRSGSNLKNLEQSMKLTSRPLEKIARASEKVRNVFSAPSRFLFEELQPRWKVASFYDMRADYVNKLNKKGIYPSEKDMKKISRELAALSNDMFGGQRFELMKNPTNFKLLDLNDPEVLKKWRRAGGYVDWTISAAKEFGKTMQGAAELLPGIPNTPTGTVARKNFVKYARNIFVATQMMNYLNTGLYRDKDGSVKWDWKKAHSTFENEDPSKHWYEFQMPDLDYEINGQKYNPGRDDRGRQRFSHFGKKFLEIFNYGKDPIRQLFNKSNPVWQTAFVQVAGGSPTLEGIPFKAEGKFERGQQLPWQGKKGWDTLGPRAQHLLKTSLPFSFQKVPDVGFLPGILDFLWTGGGAVPTTKGLSLMKAEDYYEKYLKDESKYKKDVELLDKYLETQGYKKSSIQSTKTRIKNKLYPKDKKKQAEK